MKLGELWVDPSRFNLVRVESDFLWLAATSSKSLHV